MQPQPVSLSDLFWLLGVMLCAFVVVPVVAELGNELTQRWKRHRPH